MTEECGGSRASACSELHRIRDRFQSDCLYMSVLLCGLVLIAQVSLASPQDPSTRLPAAPQGRNEGLLAEPALISSIIDVVVSHSSNAGLPKNGPYVTFGTRMPGAGWITTGAGYRKRAWRNRVSADVAGAVSWRKYSSASARVELHPLVDDRLTLGVQALRQDWTQAMYYGTGQDASQANRSQYRLRASDVAVYAAVNAGRLPDVRARVGLLNRPTLSQATGWHERDFPDTQSAFTAASAPGLTEQPRFWHADVSITADTLDHPGHPTRGHLLQAAAAAFRDRDLGRYSFRQYELVAIAFVPVVDDWWTLGARATMVASITSGANQVPFYMLPSLGGQNLLRGFDTSRFHDRDLIAVNLESRFAVFAHLDAALFADFGQVAPRLGSFSRADLESSLGVGVRLHTGAATVLRIDAARARGGWRLVLKLNDSLSFSTLKRWATVIPSGH